VGCGRGVGIKFT